MNDLLSHMNAGKKGRFNWGLNCSLLHEEKKLQVCFMLKALDIPFYTEAIFKDRKGRADIFISDRDLAIEILQTEQEEDFEKKKEYYPCRVIAINVLETVTVDRLEKLVN